MVAFSQQALKIDTLPPLLAIIWAPERVYNLQLSPDC